MEKRYQVFISSTFQDLEGARQEVSQALLRADCFPAGMELFPAADEEQFEFIKQVIQQSDYYIIISAGRYGSIHPETGLSYTEMEYDYAVEIGKPVIRLLHQDPFNKLMGDKIEKNDRAIRSLMSFREKLTRSALVRFWLTPEQLGIEATLSILHFTKRYPTTGWVRGNYDDLSVHQIDKRISSAIKSMINKSSPDEKSLKGLSRVNLDEIGPTAYFCEDCSGLGKFNGNTCEVCQGSGYHIGTL